MFFCACVLKFRGDHGSFILVPLNRTRGTLDSDCSPAQSSTRKQRFLMIQAYQFFNKPVPNSAILVPIAHEMLKHQLNCICLDNSAQGNSNAETMAQNKKHYTLKVKQGRQ